MVKGKIGGRKFVDRPNLHGYPFCWTTCFPILHACGYDKMLDLRGQAERGTDQWDHKGRGKGGIRKNKGKFAVDWIRRLQNDYGEYQPTNTKKIELPPDTKANLFVSYVVDMEKESKPKVSFHHFLKIWNTDFPRLILPKNCRLVISNIYLLTIFVVQVKCKFCGQYNAILRNSSTDKEERKLIRAKYEAHLQEVVAERRAWHDRRDQSLESERDYAAIYLDGMDQAKTDIPRLPTQDIRDIKDLNKPLKVR